MDLRSVCSNRAATQTNILKCRENCLRDNMLICRYFASSGKLSCRFCAAEVRGSNLLGSLEQVSNLQVKHGGREERPGYSLARSSMCVTGRLSGRWRSWPGTSRAPQERTHRTGAATPRLFSCPLRGNGGQPPKFSLDSRCLAVGIGRNTAATEGKDQERPKSARSHLNTKGCASGPASSRRGSRGRSPRVRLQGTRYGAGKCPRHGSVLGNSRLSCQAGIHNRREPRLLDVLCHSQRHR
jgi:hypothetical protein